MACRMGGFPMSFLRAVLSLLFGYSLLGLVEGQQQNFRVSPRDLQVLEGGEALLRCEVSNLQGKVQWTKDGFALGFSDVIVGFPRYTVLGDRSQGVYNLRISNASIEDDAEYQCQVGPAKFHASVRANARLTVISPPTSIEIVGHAPHAKVEVRENQELSLQCVVANAKPAAEILWYRGNVELQPDSRKDTVTEQAGKRFTVTSTFTLRPGPDDDYTEYSCQARHRALQPDLPMRASVQLSVLYPPGPPYIEGYTPGETIRRGQNVELVCRSRGGNPPAQLIWYKNGEQIRKAYRTAGRLSENIYTFMAEAADNKARYRCEASNSMSKKALTVEIELAVLFAPSHVSISGPTEARVGDPVPLQCTTAPSNPPAEVKWTVGGRQVRNATSRTVKAPEGGWLSTSNITAVVEPHRKSLVVVCHGLNMQLTENVVGTHTINVLYPPSAPFISGYVEGSVIPAGSVQKLMCVSSGGNPMATLTWFKNDKKINSLVKMTDKSVTAELTILANVTDNLARYRCEAANSATEIPLFETITLSVHFPPEVVKVRSEPKEWTVGVEGKLICDSSSSNPPARLSWWKDGIPVQGESNSSRPGLHGGTVSSIELKMNVTQDMNGQVYTCQASNEALQRSVNDVVTLHVLYPPVFAPHATQIVGVEGENMIISFSASGNPQNMVYTWTKDGLPITQASQTSGNERIISDGSVLNMTRLSRLDAGVYSCEALNSQGSASLNVTVDVEYGATIKSVSENVIVDPGQDVTLSCTVQGNPLSEDNIRWLRAGYAVGSDKLSTTYSNGTSYLHIKNAVREDVGNFNCIADNSIASPSTREVLLIVKFKPEMSKAVALSRAAAAAGGRGTVPCRAKAAPRPYFTWARDGQPLPVNATSKYVVEFKQIDQLTYESILLVDRVGPVDYGAYECLARNDLGFSSYTIRLDVTSAPDQPMQLTVLNVTHDSVQLSWLPGFDGGMTPTYRIRYREVSTDNYRYEDVPQGKPGEPLVHTVTGLSLATQYLFSVMAYNKLGHSKYLPDLVKSKTASIVDNDNEDSEKGDLSHLLIVLVALAILGLILINAALVACYFLRKKAKEASNQSSKSATIEMYAPSSYNDTVTGETLSSVSEKSDSYSNEDSQPDYTEESRKKSSSYISDGVNMADVPPPRYQHTENITMQPVGVGHHNTRTLPHPRSQHNAMNDIGRSRDDTSIGKTLDRNIGHGGYLMAPSPAPPMDGSYYNMTSERYFAYPPLDYTPPLDYLHSPNSIQNAGNSGTLRRHKPAHNTGVPPDVTVLHNPCGQPLHNSSPMNQLMGNNSTQYTPNYQVKSSTPPISQGTTVKQPHSILKDPARKLHNPSPTGPVNHQILSVQGASYDGVSPGLTTFAQPGILNYPETEGHLV